MSRLACVSVAFLALIPVSARAQAIANVLTPKEIADSWLLLFDGETPFGWKTEGEVKTVGGNLVLGGDKEAAITATTAFLDYELAFELQAAGKWHVGWETPAHRSLQTVQIAGGWGSCTLKVRGSTGNVDIRSAVAGSQAGSSSSATRGWGPSRVLITADAGSRLEMRNVKLRPLGLASIFNGKDLSGWRQFPRKKSKFTVNERGELNVNNGPGDLQTEGQWGDFVLQLECISNGAHLNSGVFFRCRPGEYQNGYEAQIRNQFTATPTQSYTVDEYDPRTHKKVGAHKVLSTAVDYGTGAIYRRQPARKEAARDHEWFTMTVVARGNHFATWVNGYQETDWTDNRPPSDNARTGFREAVGPLSLQGHDPTTDLSFRNLRIAELAESEKP